MPAFFYIIAGYEPYIIFREMTMDNGPQQFGKLLILIGLLTVIAGLLMIALGRLGLFKLPGDVELGSKNWQLFFPITSCILISIVLTIILWLINYFRR